MKSMQAFALLMAVATGAGVWACESVSKLDDVSIAPGQGGTTSDAGQDHEPLDAADDGDAGTADTEQPDATPMFPPSCVKPDSVLIQCNPMTNAGCEEGTTCDMAANDKGYGFVCFPTGTVDEGQPCNGVSGPWCKPTLHCGTDKCVKFCCTAADCDGSGCGMYDPIKVGTFGWCN